MTSYKIEWKQSARKELKRLGKPVILQILKAVEALAENPHPIGSRKIRGADRTYRVRVGHRKEVYEKLI